MKRNKVSANVSKNNKRLKLESNKSELTNDSAPNQSTSKPKANRSGTSKIVNKNEDSPSIVEDGSTNDIINEIEFKFLLRDPKTVSDGKNRACIFFIINVTMTYHILTNNFSILLQ